MKKELMELAEKIERLPDDSIQAKFKWLGLFNNCKKAKKSMEEIESQTMSRVAMVTDDMGKKIFTNQDLREAEVMNRLKSDGEYLALKDQVDFTETELEKARMQVEYFEDLKLSIVQRIKVFTYLDKIENE